MGNNIMQIRYRDIKKMFTWTYVQKLLFDPAHLAFVAFCILVAELILNVVIVHKVPYTEIDWQAYMQECEGFLNGTLDYSKLRGDTGPLVYPAGFVYIYSLLYIITRHGENVRLAQYIFIGVYLLLLILILRIYVKTKKVPPYVLAITILTSYRIHSIHVLRMFNDPIAVLLLYASLNCFLDSRWYLGSFIYSLAVSVKMNILLYAPALFFFYLINLGFKDMIKQLLVCGLTQLFLGLPFLLSNPVAYIRGSFDLGRVFNHTWTVNYRFMDVKVFESTWFHLMLLGIHVMLLLLFLPMCVQYFKSYCRLCYVQRQVQPQIDAKNLENKKNIKAKKIKSKLDNNEDLTKDQEQLLKSFENMLKESASKGSNKAVKEKGSHSKTLDYSINFDILSQLFILPMFLVNFIGVVCARSLHYQFYSWYFHTLPYLLWSTNFTLVVRLLILALIEFCWNTYPSSDFTSFLLHVCHISILYGVYIKMSREFNFVSESNKDM